MLGLIGSGQRSARNRSNTGPAGQNDERKDLAVCSHGRHKKPYKTLVSWILNIWTKLENPRTAGRIRLEGLGQLNRSDQHLLLANDLRLVPLAGDILEQDHVAR